MKQYISNHADRTIPVGYSSADVAENIESQALYFACGEDEWARSDFFAFNDYSWCEPSSFTQSGWNVKVRTYGDYSLPLFLSEFGCITNTRTWGEIEALYSPKMTIAYSGGLVYEYTLEANGYGLVAVGSNGNVVPNEDFRRLQQAYEETPNPSGDGGARRDTDVPECPLQTRQWNVDTEKLPVMPTGAEKYMQTGAGKGPGLGGDGSQWAGTPSETSPDLSDGVTESESGNESSGSDSSNGNDDSGEESAAPLVPPRSMKSTLCGVVVVAVGLFLMG